MGGLGRAVLAAAWLMRPRVADVGRSGLDISLGKQGLMWLCQDGSLDLICCT